MIITGPGISVESGIPSFQGAGRFYRGHDSHEIAHPAMFEKAPSLVWEYYNYVRGLVFDTTPNKVCSLSIAKYSEFVD